MKLAIVGSRTIELESIVKGFGLHLDYSVESQGDGFSCLDIYNIACDTDKLAGIFFNYRTNRVDNISLLSGS